MIMTYHTLLLVLLGLLFMRNLWSMQSIRFSPVSPALWIVAVGISVICYAYIRWKHSYWQRLDVPYVKPTFLVGNTLQRLGIGAPFYKFFDEVHQHKNGALICGYYEFLKPGLVIADINLMKNFFMKEFDSFADRRTFEMKQVNTVVDQMITNAQGEDWHRLRKILSPSFTSHKVRQLYPLIKNQCDGLLQKLYEISRINNKVETRDVCGNFTMNTIATCAFGIECSMETVETIKFSEMASKLFSMTFTRALKIVILLVAPKLAALMTLFGIEFVSPEFISLEQNLRSVLRSREKQGLRRGDFLDLMKESEETISEDVMVGQAIVFLLAGYDNTANTLAFTLHLLAMNKKIQEKLRSQIRSYQTRSHLGISVMDAIQENEYLDCVVNETLRLYPVSPIVERRCTKDIRIPGIDLAVTKGQPILFSLWSLHRSLDYWAEPEKFNPDRFLGNRHGHNMAYLPFGFGPRICIGRKFSTFVIKIALWHILDNYEVSSHDDTIDPPPLESKVLSIKTTNSLPLTFTSLRK